MKKYFFLVTLYGFFNCSFLLFGGVLGEEFGGDSRLKNGDFEIWNYNVIHGKLYKNVWLLAINNFRYDRTASQFYHFYEHFQINWYPCSFLGIGPAYRQIFTRVDKENWIPVYYPNLNITFLLERAYLQFTDRSRIVYEMVSPSRFNAWIYRNKFKIHTINGYTSLDMRFFAETEVFFRQRRGFEEYRFSAGMNMHVVPKIRFEMGYRFISEKWIDSWFNKNVLLLNLKAYF